MKYSLVLLLVLLTCLGAFLHVYNFNWGAPFYFHPDERNMAAAVNQLQFPTNLNPHFFAYGSFPLYITYFTGLISNFFSSCHMSFAQCSVSFEQAIVISRLYSALLATLLIPVMFIIGTKLFHEIGGIIAAVLTTLSVGFIQFAHFGTVEMYLTFFGTILFYLIITTGQKITKKHLVSFGIIMGILVATKISSLALLPLPILLFFYRHFHHSRELFGTIGKTSIDALLFMWVTGVIYVVTNPFIIFDTPAFLNSMRYESTLATGVLPVFYTQEFLNTTPLVFQFRFIYPFLITPLITLLFPIAFIFLVSRAIKKFDLKITFLVAFFLILFFSQAVLFVKWTRYMLPTLPFIYLIITGALVALAHRTKVLAYAFTFIILAVSGVTAFAYFLTAFAMPDTRVTAAAFAKHALPKNAAILSEVYDLGIVPFTTDFSQITLFNFYDLETANPEASPEKLSELLAQTDYIILPSQRLYKTRTKNSRRFPQAFAFYNALQQENGYKKIYETPCDIFCQITYLHDPIFSYEGTANIFDRPTVMIYKKI